MRHLLPGAAWPLLLGLLASCAPADWVSRGDGAAERPLAADTVRRVERDVEAPDVFATEDRALWDGRPSLGGIWVAAPEVSDPERVIIRNVSTGKFVIGALFQRDRDAGSGPPLQLSSDAADALGVQAGRATPVSVIALRKEAVAEDADAATGAPAEPRASLAASVEDALSDVPEAEPLAAAPLPSAALPAATAAPARTAALPARSTASGGLDKPYLQIGTFSVERNARNTAEAMRQAGIVPTVVETDFRGRTFWRVIVGPAGSSRDRAAVLRTVKGLGFGDAYPVSG